MPLMDGAAHSAGPPLMVIFVVSKMFVPMSGFKGHTNIHIWLYIHESIQPCHMDNEGIHGWMFVWTALICHPSLCGHSLIRGTEAVHSALSSSGAMALQVGEYSVCPWEVSSGSSCAAILDPPPKYTHF